MTNTSDTPETDALIGELAAQQRLVEALRKDAERWKFCEVNGYPRHILPNNPSSSFVDAMQKVGIARPEYWVATIDKTQESFHGDTPAAAIDAAIAAKEGA